MVLTQTMDASRTDVESCAPLKDARGCKLTLLVALQNVLLIGCLLTALYFYWTNNKAVEFPEDVHIQFAPTAGFYGNTTLKFANVQHKNLMDLHDGSRISIQCRGPYIVHMHVCYSIRDQTSGTLVLQVTGNQDPRSTFELQPHTPDYVCRGLQSIAYLYENEEAELRLYSTENFMIKDVTVGVHYLLSRCES